MSRIAILRWNNLTFDLEEELTKRGHQVLNSKNINKDDFNTPIEIITFGIINSNT